MKDAKGHGSNSRGAHQDGIAQATGPKITLQAEARQFIPHADPNQARWDIQSRTYQYGGANRKAAINYGLSKIQKEFPNHPEHNVEIKD